MNVQLVLQWGTGGPVVRGVAICWAELGSLCEPETYDLFVQIIFPCVLAPYPMSKNFIADTHTKMTRDVKSNSLTVIAREIK